MTLVLPSIAPVQFGTTSNAFNENPVNRNGSTFIVESSVAVPASTVITTVIGIVPFNKGARIHYKGNELYIPGWDSSTNVTFTVGWTYYDSTLGTSQAAGFKASQTTGQSATGGFVSFDVAPGATGGYQFIAAADGWVTVTTAGGSTTTLGTIYSEILMSYNSSPVYS